MQTGPLGKVSARDGTQLYVRELGEGPTLLFVASWALYSGMWEYQVAHFSERGFRCVTFDRRGHGRSDIPRGGYDMDTLADDLASVIEALDLRDVVLIAHSMGAAESLHYLARHGCARVRKLVTLGAVAPFVLATADNPYGAPEQVHLQTLARYARDLPQWAYDFQAGFFSEQTSVPLKELLTRQLLDVPPAIAMRCFRSLYSTDLRPDLRKIDLPVLILHGALDVQAPLSITGERLVAGLPNAELVVYPDAPHGIFITHLDRVNRDIAAFLA